VQQLTWLIAIVAAAAVNVAAQPSSSPAITGSVRSYHVLRGDTLGSIGARFGVDPGTLAADNGLGSAATLAAGRTIVVDNRHLVPAAVDGADIVINIPQRMLFHLDGGVTAFPVAVGRRDWPTPRGRFTVVVLERHPTWDVPASIAEEARRRGRELPKSIPPGPDNPLGDFWIGLSGGGIGIHGTNAPGSIYRTATHGCIRLHPDDVAWLFPRVTPGAAVATIYLPVLLAEVDGRVYLEVHADAYRKAPDALAQVRTHAEAQGLTEAIDWDAAGATVRARQGIARDVTKAADP
jgi:L,D-transpeptidase ErfK/SrfK